MIDKTIAAILALPDVKHGYFVWQAPNHELEGGFRLEDLRALAAELKELREFVGAMNSIGIEEWVGRWKQGAFWFYDSAGILVEYGTDPFDAWQKLQGESK